MLVSVKDVAFSYGDNQIIEGASLDINDGERIALIGANGEGKTTLIRLILGELTPDNGEIFVKGGARIGYLAQNGGYSSGNTVTEEMRQVFAEDIAAVNRLSQLSAELSAVPPASDEYRRISAKLNAVTDFINSRRSFDVDLKIKTVLNGMGFMHSYDRIVDSMSGGEKTRLKLARLLLEEPDLLVLDEPTNHLDISTLFWLEEYLAGYKGAVLLVSHDRYFLDRVCAKTAELENRRLVVYSGNYTKYKTLKQERQTRLLKEYEAAVEQAKKLQDYIDRNIVRATTAKSAQSRVKQLQKLDIPQKPYVPPRPPQFTFTYAERPYERVLTVKDLNLKKGDKTLICGGQFAINRGQKVALVGENGTGKTTLLKAVAQGDIHAERGRYVKIALFDQEGLNLNPNNTVLAELWERHVGFSQTDIRASLARCGLVAEDMQKQVKDLSGGERAKLALCILQSENANFLLLDEPTNHLDLPARESLERALKQFDGTLLFVSHDRYFISALADGILEIENQKLCYYQGGYGMYRAAKAQRAAEEAAAADLAQTERLAHEKAEGYRSKKERAEEVKKKERIKSLEAQITSLEEEEAQLNASLADPSVTSDYRQVTQISQRLSQIKNLLDGLYSEYSDMI